MMHDLNISSCAKDIIFKPMLCNQSEQDKKKLREEITDWQALVIDTYEEVKKETTQKPDDAEDRRAKFSRHQPKTTDSEGLHPVFKEKEGNPYMKDAALRDLRQSEPGVLPGEEIKQINTDDSKQRPLSHFFGELEIKGLINLSFYAFYCQIELDQHLNQRDLDRVSKLVVILIREVVQQFQDSKDYIHLLTILLYLLQCNLKTANANFKRKAIMEDVVRLLLFIFNYYKPPLNREQFITVSQDQFP